MAMWDDYRTVMAVAQAGSLSGAARRLGVSHATVFRRLGEIERRIGARLFERSRTGYAPTIAGEDVLRAAVRIEAEVLGVERRIGGQDLRPSGTVRLTTTDTLLTGLLSPMLAAFRREHPEIALEVAVSNEVFDLTRREADDRRTSGATAARGAGRPQARPDYPGGLWPGGRPTED